MNTNSLLKSMLIGLLLLLAVAVIILSLVPPVSKDALIHHLAVPKLYLSNGGMYEIPSMNFSYYPMNVELLYMIPLALHNDIAPKLIHFVFALLTAWLIFRYLAKRCGSVYGLLGALFFLSVPVIIKLSITAYVDLGLLFFTMASLYFLLKWLENNFSRKYLLISALMCGLAMGTKYNGLIVFFLLTLFTSFFHSRHAPISEKTFVRSAGYGLLFMITALLIYAPWGIRNIMWTNNPVYPLYDSLFNPGNPHVQASVSIFTFRGELYGESWWEVLLLPLRIFFQGQDGSPRFFDGTLTPFLLIFPLLAVFFLHRDESRERLEKMVLLAFSFLYFLFVFLIRDVRIRYLAPILPPLVILSVYGIRSMFDAARAQVSPDRRKTGLIVVCTLVVAAMLFNGQYLYGQFRYVKPFQYFSGRINRDAYISRYRTEYPLMQHINSHLPQEAKILFLFVGKRGYYCDREYILDMRDYRGTHSILMEALEQSDSPEDLLMKLKGQGITHLLIYHTIFDEWTQTNMKLGEYERLKAFFKTYMDLEIFQDNYGLSRLKDLPQ